MNSTSYVTVVFDMKKYAEVFLVIGLSILIGMFAIFVSDNLALTRSRDVYELQFSSTLKSFVTENNWWSGSIFVAEFDDGHIIYIRSISEVNIGGEYNVYYNHYQERYAIRIVE